LSGQIVHVGDEDYAVGRLGEKTAHPCEAFGGGYDLEFGGRVQGQSPTILSVIAWNELSLSSYRDRGEQGNRDQ